MDNDRKSIKKVNISQPQLSIEEIQAVAAVIQLGKLAQGERVAEFEKQFARYIGVKHAVAVSSGTDALYLSLLAAGIKKGDEIITSPFTFIASANAIQMTGARVVFADINPQTFNIDPAEIKRKITSRTKAILPIHLFGLSAEMKQIISIAKKDNLIVIEDACQAHGAEYYGKKAGSIGLAGCFSFYPTKNMTTGEGGMITTNSSLLAQKIRLLRSHGMKIQYHHEILGVNARMTEIEAAIGIVQLKKLPAFTKKRIRNANLYLKLLQNTKGIKLPTISDGFIHVFHQFTIRLSSDFAMSRDNFQKLLEEQGVKSGIYYPIPLHKQKVYSQYANQWYPYAEQASKEVISLPVHPGVLPADIQKICRLINEISTS